MILAELRDYLRERGQASLQDLVHHFDADPEALRGMLDYWVRRGQVRRQPTNPACGTRCSQCDAAAVEIYVWGQGPQLAGVPWVVERCPG